MASCDLSQVDLLRLQSKQTEPNMVTVEQLVIQLKEAGQVIQTTLDDMLCHTPVENRKKLVMEERRISRRTRRPLQSTLLSE